MSLWRVRQEKQRLQESVETATGEARLQESVETTTGEAASSAVCREGDMREAAST